MLGEKTIAIKSKEGVTKKIKFQMADVTRVLASVGKIASAGNQVIMSKQGGVIKDKDDNVINLELENGVYVVKGMVKTQGEQHQARVFHRQGM